MYISKVHIKNFRLLQDTEMVIDENQKDLSILLGRNNSGKTSFVSIFEKFLLNPNFNFYDFPLVLRQKLIEFNEETDVNDLLIQLVITIQYFQEDSFEYISNFFMDLSPEVFEINILCECSIKKEQFLKSISEIGEDDDIKKKHIENNLGKYLDISFYSFLDEEDLEPENRHKLVKRDKRDIEQLINIQVVHAKRDVASSEASSASGALSKLANIYFDKEYGHQENNYTRINKEIFKMDDSLNSLYDTHFKNFLSMAKDFLSLSNLQVKSNLESKRLFASASKITYGDSNLSLPENLNGLGHLNILYLLIQLELIKAEFLKNSKDINLLFIEEPEAHTHPQMQYIFAKHIKKALEEIEKSQTFITTHSSHIVTQCDFKDIKYFKSCDENKNIRIQNFYSELESKYSSELGYFKFLKQYLTLYSAELFFAEKVIFIEGTSEAMLLPYFMQEVDKEINDPKISLASQNITIIEAGANAKVFGHFLEFLGIKTLIITDIDTVNIQQNKNNKDDLMACPVKDGVATSNETIKYYLRAPVIKLDDFIADDENKKQYAEWFNTLLNSHIDNGNILVSYQLKAQNYHARSFEDAFISENFELIKIHKDNIEGLKNRSEIDEFNPVNDSFYQLTDEVLYSNKKSDFAASILYLALTEDIKWQVPFYIREGLKWIAK